MASILPATSTDSQKYLGKSFHVPKASSPTTIVHDDGSDYGDFTLDEQEIINELLANLTPHKAIADEPLGLTDIEDYEDPKSVRLPKASGKESWVPPWMQPREQQPQAREAAQGILEDQTPHNISTATNSIHSSFLRR